MHQRLLGLLNDIVHALYYYGADFACLLDVDRAGEIRATRVLIQLRVVFVLHLFPTNIIRWFRRVRLLGLSQIWLCLGTVCVDPFGALGLIHFDN